MMWWWVCWCWPMMWWHGAHGVSAVHHGCMPALLAHGARGGAAKAAGGVAPVAIGPHVVAALALEVHRWPMMWWWVCWCWPMMRWCMTQHSLVLALQFIAAGVAATARS